MLSTFDEPIDAEFDDPGVIDPGGSVAAAPVKAKRTRAPNKPKVENSGGVKAETGSYYLLVKGGLVVTYTADPAEIRKAAANAIIDPDHTLFRAERIEPDDVFQK